MSNAPPGYQSSFARLHHALELRREGRTYKEIAERTGLRNEHAAQKLIATAIKRVLKETAEEVRSIELSRLEVLITCLWDKTLEDLEEKHPHFARFDRLKQLLEAKLKWCGAQAVLEDSGKDSRVTIVVNSYIKNDTHIDNSTALVKTAANRDDIEAELALLVPDDAKKELF